MLLGYQALAVANLCLALHWLGAANGFVMPTPPTTTGGGGGFASRHPMSGITRLASAPTTTSGGPPDTATTAARNDEDEDAEVLTSRGLLKRDRYVATNRFSVRKDRAPKFEQRWATRKSRLASLEGFQYFHLMRRVTLNEDGTCSYEEGENEDEAFGNYVSFTIWKKKSNFSAWRKGDAFKEAHGGTSITAFVGTMINSAFVLRGPPRPAFYDGLLLQKNIPDTVPKTRDGWRTIEADGLTTLPPECFVSCNQFYVPSENAASFEKRWADRESKLMDCEGFVAFMMMRRDGTAKGHGTSPVSNEEPTYLSTTIWENRAAFDKWRSGQKFQKAHGQQKPKKGQAEGGESVTASPPPPQWSRPPKPVFYEGTLVISSVDGA